MTFPPGLLYHPNVGKDGEICGDTIAKVFGPTKNVTDLARMVRSSCGAPLSVHACLCTGYFVYGNPKSGITS